ncbi:MAG: glycoside hydrolase family 57 protein [Gemmatimonadota bacterium]
MPDICIYAQVHQPFRLRHFSVFDIGGGLDYFDDETNRRILRRVGDKCYLPANQLLEDLIRRSEGRFKVALSLSGVLIEQLALWAPDVLASFQSLVATGGVELLGETYDHSLASLANSEEFVAQVERHREVLQRYFGRQPTVFRNTELIYWDGLAPDIARLGFAGVMVEGADHVMEWRSPNHVYEAAGTPGLRLIPRNYRLSDDVGFRFSNRDWDGWPLTAEKYAEWIAGSDGESMHLFIDYETLGEHQWAETGIFSFVERLPWECLARGLSFVHPSTLAARPAVAPLAFARPTSWADLERDTSAWLGNRLQYAAHERLYGLRRDVLATGDAGLIDRWRRLTTSDHLYYMCTKWFADGDVHKYFSPYESPYDAFVVFMNVLQDLEQLIPEASAAEVTNDFDGWAESGMACVG